MPASIDSAWVILNANKKQYLAGGTVYSLKYELTDNPLLAHIYASYEIAEKQARTIMRTAAKQKQVVDLRICEIRGAVTSTSNPVDLGEAKSGYAIKISVAGLDPGRHQTYVVRKYSMLSRVVDPNDTYYRSVRHIMGNTPTLWKTLEGAQEVMQRLVAEMPKTSYGADISYEVVEYTE